MISEWEMNPPLKLLIALADVPNDAYVTKRTGDKVYKVTREIRIYSGGYGGQPQRVKPDAGVAFLLDLDGGSNVNATVETTLVLWHVSDEDLLMWLNARVNGLCEQ